MTAVAKGQRWTDERMDENQARTRRPGRARARMTSTSSNGAQTLAYTAGTVRPRTNEKGCGASERQANDRHLSGTQHVPMQTAWAGC